VRFCVYATSTKRPPKSRGIIAGTEADNTRPLFVPDGVLHGARVRDAWTLCGLSTEGLNRFDVYDFETVSISAGGCERCAEAIDEVD